MRTTPLCIVLLLCACAEKPAPSAPALVASKAEPAAPAPTAAHVAQTDAGSPMSTAPSATAAALGASAVPTATGAASAVPSSTPVRVRNIGMHIGGGPNDDATKAPIAQSVAPHFAEIEACYANSVSPAKKGDFGIDLLIEAKGGLAKVSNPRTTLAGEAFRTCMVRIFEATEFLPPKGGKTMVSYSLGFELR